VEHVSSRTPVRATLYAFDVQAAITIVALPVTGAVLWLLLHSSAGERLVAVPVRERWHDRPTPTFGGVGIFAGLTAAIALAVAAGAVDASSELLGIVVGAAVVFAAGLADDLRGLSPVAKLAAQVLAASVAVALGLEVQLVDNDVLATAIALLWLVGITNAFNLLDNMDGLAATLATIACGYFALAAATADPVNDLVVVVALALGFGSLGFVPFNLRPSRDAAVFMGDSGSQLLGFTLAALGLASSWTVAGTTTATVLLPLLVLAIPILDTTLVTVVRLLERRPVTQGGRDHASHRLVYYGLSERKAVALLALISRALGATAVAYNILDNPRVTAVGVLVTFAILVQFASFLSDLEERTRRGQLAQEPTFLQALFSQPRRLLEMLADFVLICASFLLAYLLVVGGKGGEWQRGTFLAALPILLGLRYLAFTAAGVYRRVWRFAGPADLVAVVVACVASAAAALGIVVATRPLQDFPWQVFLLDAVLCSFLVAGSRLVYRAASIFRARRASPHRSRVLVVGAGRSGRSLARELQETPGSQVVGFVDDNPSVRRRRVRGVLVAGDLDELESVLAGVRPDEVLVTIPDAPAERLAKVTSACTAAGIPFRFVRREIVAVPDLVRVP
jgi:UDP-GlcNAc:undecaprenyl-phosphate GlcNAc-1-phosphate transferase